MRRVRLGLSWGRGGGLAGVFERFTERARKVVVLAQYEAEHFRHNYIGTEHLLLGLLGEGDGVAAQTLLASGLDIDEVRGRVESIVGYGEEGTGQAPFTPRSKKVLELSLRETMGLGHNFIGTEHLLLGLLGEGGGVAARVLSDLGVDPDEVRKEVLRRLGVVHDSDPMDRVEGRPVREAMRDRTLFRGKVERIEIRARAGQRPLIVSLDYVYSVPDTDEPPEVIDHEALLDRVVGVFERNGPDNVEGGIRDAGWAVLEQFPAVLELTIGATRERTLEGRASSGTTVTRTFRR